MNMRARSLAGVAGAVSALVLLCGTRHLADPATAGRTLLAGGAMPAMTIPLQDLVRQAPLWAPETVEPVSDGFNAWMDTLPFGESDRHRELRERWSLSHPGEGDEARTDRAPVQTLAQMLRLQVLAPNQWTDYTMGGDGVKCVCDSTAAGDEEMEGLDPNVKPACTCTGGRTTQFSKTEEGGPLDTGGHGAWPQGLPGVDGRGDGAAYVDGIVGNNAYKPVGKDATILYAQPLHAAEDQVGDDYVHGDDYGMLPSSRRQRAFDSSYDAKNDFKYRSVKRTHTLHAERRSQEEGGSARASEGANGRCRADDC